MNRIFYRKSRRVTALMCVLTLMFTLVLPVQTASAAGPAGVSNRVLSMSKAGDSSDWVEIAKSGDYSLILRKDVLPVGYVNFPKSGTNNNYTVSNARDVVNNWFKNTLSSSAKLRDFTVKHNALNDLGGFASTTYGLSTPNGMSARTGDDVAFLLSFAEAANFCSMQYGTSTTSWTKSPTVARNNFAKLTQLPTSPPQRDFWWLRSAGFSNTNVCSVGTHSSAMANTVWASSALSSSGATYVYIRPALWVGSGIFDEYYPITVKYYKDGISSANFLDQVSLPPALQGSTITGVNLTSFAPPGYTTPGTRSGATVVEAKENIVNVVYTKTSEKYPIYVYYYQGTVLLGVDPLPLAVEGSAIVGVDPYKFAPPGYGVPGTVSGDTIVKSPFSIVFVRYYPL